MYHPYYGSYAAAFVEENNQENYQIDEIIMRDGVENLHEIISSVGFDVNERVPQSIFKHPILQYNATLLTLWEFYGAIKCFIHLILNGAEYSEFPTYDLRATVLFEFQQTINDEIENLKRVMPKYQLQEVISR